MEVEFGDCVGRVVEQCTSSLCVINKLYKSNLFCVEVEVGGCRNSGKTINVNKKLDKFNLFCVEVGGRVGKMSEEGLEGGFKSHHMCIY